jgi:magnesium transporter
MKDTIGLIVNRLTLGFTFAFIYQIFVGIATSLLGLPLTGNIQDLFSGFEKFGSDEGYLLIVWWIISTVIITTIALLIVRYKKYLSPYKDEKNIEIPPKITVLTAIIIGAIISFLFFIIDLILGSIVDISSKTDVQAVYQAALNGNFAPLSISILFSIIAGFTIIGVASKTAKVREFTKDFGIRDLARINKLIKKNEDTKTTADTLGLRPGALIHVGERKVDKAKFSILEYNGKDYFEQKDATLEDCLKTKATENVSWIKVSGIHDPEIIQNFGKRFGIHPLIQSDIMNTELRPKFEDHADYIFLILKIPYFDEKGRLEIDQISILLAKNYVVTFQESEDDIFEPIRKRIKESVGTMRNRKSDYLSYALTDVIIDNYFVVMEKIGNLTEVLEEELMSNPTKQTLNTIYLLKRQMTTLRKSTWPSRDVIDSFERSQSPLIDADTRAYIRDAYSHAVQVMDTVESLREMVGGMLDTYLSSLSNRMNEVMKTLTIIASIFIPITFIAGIYGTNFEYIPELSWHGSYFVMLGVMILITGIMIVYFKKKQWL